MVMREVAIDFAEKLGHVATEPTKQRWCERAGDAVAAVDRYLHRARERDIARDAVEVRGGDVPAAVAPGAGTERTGFDAHLQSLDVVARECVAGDHHLEPVVVRRIVAAGHYDAALCLELVRREIAHRRRDHPDVDHVRSARPDPVGKGAAKLRPGKPAVAGDDDSVATAIERERAQRLADTAHDRRRQRLADDAADVVGLEDFCRKLRHCEPH